MIKPGALLWVVGGAVASVALSGCAYGELRQVLRAQVASELDCAEVQIEYKDLRYHEEDTSKERFKVTACGVERTYTCPQDPGLVSYDEKVCTFVDGDPDRPEVATMEDSAGGDAADEPMDEPVDEPAPAPKDKPAPAPKAKPAKAKPTGLPRAVEPDDADAADDQDDGLGGGAQPACYSHGDACNGVFLECSC